MTKTLPFNTPLIGADQDLVMRLSREAHQDAQFLDSTNECADALPQFGAVRNRRTTVRYTVTMPTVCFPILSSDEVDTQSRIDGIITDVSNEGFGMRLATRGVAEGDRFIVAVSIDGEDYRFTDVEVKNISGFSQDSVILNTSVSGPFKKLFSEPIIHPVLDRNVMRYSFPFSESVMKSLCSIGAAQEMILDELLVCPDCQSLPTLRRGCCVCLSSHVKQTKMIHHFACANVDLVERFESGSDLACPKCRGRKMIIGADFEYLNGPNQCLDCGHSDLETIPIGHCMNCENRFSMTAAHKFEIVGYRVNRLDVLDLIRTV